MKNRFLEIPLLAKVWICHIFLFFPIRGWFFLMKFEEQPVNFLRLFKSIVMSPFAGIYGMFDKFPLLILIEMIVTYLIIKVTNRIISSYLITVVITGILFYLFKIYNGVYLKDFLISFSIYLVIFLLIFRKKLRFTPNVHESTDL